jgi:hypothetical protein
MVLWRQSLTAREKLPPLDPGEYAIDTLPDEVRPVVEEIKKRRVYQSAYERAADYHFGLAPIAGLLAPQWQADLDYVEELAAGLSKRIGMAELLRFTMPEGTVPEAMVRGNQVLFTSPRPDLNVVPVPDVRQLEHGDVEIVIRASSRPNYVQVAQLGGRLVLVNGVHKVLALAKQGHMRTPCVWRRVHQLAETGLNPQQTTLYADQTFNGRRPAMVLDFLDEQVAVLLSMRATHNVLRVSIGVEGFQAPAVQASETNVTELRKAAGE